MAESTLASLRHCHGPFQRALVLENPDPLLDGYLSNMGIAVDRIDDAPDEEERHSSWPRGGTI